MTKASNTKAASTKALAKAQRYHDHHARGGTVVEQISAFRKAKQTPR